MFPILFFVACGGSGGSGSPVSPEGEVYQLTEHKRISRLAGYGIYKDAWKDELPSTHIASNCYLRTQGSYAQPLVPYFKNGTDCAFGMDLGFPTPVRGYPKDPSGRLYYFFGDTDPLDKTWLDSFGVVARVQSSSTMSGSTSFGETPFPLGTTNGDSISWFTDTQPSNGLDMAHTLRNTEGVDTQYDTVATGVLASAFRSTVVRLNDAQGSGPTYSSAGGPKHRKGMGQDFLMGIDVPAGILYLDNRTASDPGLRKEYLFNFRWYQPHEVILQGLGVVGDIWKANYMVNSFTMISVSTDLGLSWNACQQRSGQWPKPFSGWDPGAGSFQNSSWGSSAVVGKFINLAFLEVDSTEFSYLPVSDPDLQARATDGRYVLIFGYGVGQNLNLHLACVPREQLIALAEGASVLGTTLHGLRFFGGLDASGLPLWKKAEAEALPICRISHPRIREELETHCIRHSDPSVKIQLVQESVGGAWTLSIQRIQTSFTGRSGKLVNFDRLVAVIDFGYSALIKNLKKNAGGSVPATVSLSQLTSSDHAPGSQATAQPGPVFFTADPRYPWAWNVKDPTSITAANVSNTRPFRPLFLPKASDDTPIVDNPAHDIGDAPGTVCGTRQLLAAPGGPHDDWTQRSFDGSDPSRRGTEFVGSPFLIGCLSQGVSHSATTKAGVLLYFSGVHYGYSVDLFSIKLTKPEW